MAFVNMYTVLGNYLSSPTYNLTAEQILYFRLTGLFGMLLSPLTGRLTNMKIGGYAQTFILLGMILFYWFCS